MRTGLARRLAAAALGLVAAGAVALALLGSAPPVQAQPRAPAAQPAAPQRSGQPPTTPFLRIEVEQHTAALTRLAVDAAGRLLATAALDKTVRLWSPEDGSARGVLRVPIGPEGEGELYAVAITPDGHRVFAAGFSGWSWDRSFSLYVFDVARGEMIGRLSGLPAPVNHLAISRDGKRLAAALGGRAGLRVLDAANGRLLFEDRDYGGPARMAIFDRFGRLAVSAADGHVRVYDAEHRKIADQVPQRGAHPYGIAFSPEGTLLAVGYEDRLRVDVLFTADLRAAYAPTVEGLEGEALPAVAWSHDDEGGLQLYAGGYARQADGAFVVRRWSDFGMGRALDQPVSRDAVSQLLALPRGGLVFAAADPGWGRIGAEGVLSLALTPPTLEFRGIRSGRLAVSADGAVAEFSTARGGGQPLRFDLRQRLLGPASGEGELAAPVTETGGFAVRDFDDADRPRLNNRSLALGRGEFARSATLLPAAGQVLLGTDTHLRLYDRNGRELANLPAPATVWGVTANAEGTVAVAALGDGTLRWYGLRGEEVLRERAALFPHPDGRRWVLWTPEGFFDNADQGGNELVGVHLNRGAGQAPEWISFAQAYRTLYAPNIVRARLLGDAGPAWQRQAELGDIRTRIDSYPRVAVAAVCVQGDEGCSPIGTNGRARLPAGARSVQITLDITDRGLGVGAIDMFVNERNRGRVQLSQPPQQGNRVRQLLVAELDPGVNALQVRVYDGGNDLFATTAPLRFETDADTTPAANGRRQAGRLFALAVGVDRYRNTSLNLRFAGTDARTFADLVRAQSAPLFRDASVRLLLDEEATTSNIVSALEAIAREATAEDTFFLYLAGHGIRSRLDGRFLFLSHDVADLSSDQAVARQALTERGLIGALARIRARNGFLFVDTCYSGAVTLDNLANIGHETGRYLLAASNSVQEALDSYDNRNGVFAFALKEAFAGRAPRDEEGVISSLSLGEYISRRVPALARQKRHDQEAVFKTAQRELHAFPVARAQAARR